jgi:hypothetical protein
LHKKGFWGDNHERTDYLKQVPGIFRESFPPAPYDFKPTVEISPLAPAGPQILGEAKARNTLKMDGKAHIPSLEWDKSEVSLVNTFSFYEYHNIWIV